MFCGFEFSHSRFRLGNQRKRFRDFPLGLFLFLAKDRDCSIDTGIFQIKYSENKERRGAQTQHAGSLLSDV